MLCLGAARGGGAAPLVASGRCVRGDLEASRKSNAHAVWWNLVKVNDDDDDDDDDDDVHICMYLLVHCRSGLWLNLASLGRRCEDVACVFGL